MKGDEGMEVQKWKKIAFMDGSSVAYNICSHY